MNEETEPQTLDDVIPPSIKIAPLPPTVKISEDDKERFFKSFLADADYEETLSRLGGKLNITLRTLTINENYDVFNQIDLDRKNGRAKSEDQYLMVVVQYRLALSLVSINGKRFCEQVTKESFETDTANQVSYVRKRTEELQAWPTHKLAAFVQTYNEFETKVHQLTSEVANADFWVAAV